MSAPPPRKATRHTRTPETPAEHAPAHREQLGLERLVFFTDAVFAIAITLLALEIRLPPVEGEVTDGQLLALLANIWPSYLGFAVSFLVIGVFWIGHHRRFGLIVRYDRGLILLNLLLLMVIAFIPFPTSVLSEHGNRTSVIFYAATMALAGLLSAAIWTYASRNNRLLEGDVTAAERRQEMVRSLVVPGMFALSIPVALASADAAMFLWLLVGVPAWWLTR